MTPRTTPRRTAPPRTTPPRTTPRRILPGARSARERGPATQAGHGAPRRVSIVAAATVLGLALVAGCGSSADDAGARATDGQPSGEQTGAERAGGTPTPVEPTSGAPGGDVQGASACDGSDLLASLSTRQKLAQMLTVGVTDTADAVDVVGSEQVGGVFIGSWTDASMFTGGGVAQATAASSIPPLVTIDEEGGRVARMSDALGIDSPSARTVAATMTVDEAYQEALERGQQLHEAGITVDFAPDVDVSAQPDDAAIGDRSYSDDPQTVVEYATATARGLRDAGVQPVIKHFPGHGSSSGDSHTGAVSVPAVDQLQSKDLVPFREMVGTDVGVMVGHLDVPGLTDGVPASLSPPAMSLLRDGTGYGAAPFDGVIFTDDLSGMSAITDTYSVPEAVLTAIEAGADVALWLTTDQVPAVLDRLEQAVTSGELPMEQVDKSVVRVAGMKGLLSCD